MGTQLINLDEQLNYDYLPFATYVDLNPITADGKVPYAATIRASMSGIYEFSVACFTVGAAHDSSNFYTIKLELRQASGTTQIASVDTKTLGSGVAGLKVFTTTSISPSLVIGTGYFYLLVSKTNTPSDLYIIMPILKFKYA